MSLDDELFARFASWLLPIIRVVRPVVGGRLSLAVLRRVAQARAEWQGRRGRLAHSKADRDQERRLAFAGQSE